MASSASSDEGEIRDGNAEKATTSLPRFDGTSVDRPDRNRSSNSNSMSPEHEQMAGERISRRSRSPYSDLPPRGSKRARDDDYGERARGDPRRFKVHYEDAAPDYKRRSRVSYEDLDQGQTSNPDLRYDDRDARAEKRPRTRSRSPYRSNRGEERNGRGGPPRRDGNRYGGNADSSRSNSYGRGDGRNRDYKDQPVSKRGQTPLPADYAKHKAKTTQGHQQQSTDQTTDEIDLEK